MKDAATVICHLVHCSPILSRSCMCEATLYKTVLIAIKMSGFPIIEVKMNLLLMFEDAAFFSLVVHLTLLSLFTHPASTLVRRGSWGSRGARRFG